MIACRDLEVTDPRVFLMPIGHLGARVLAYYLTLEEQQQAKRRIDRAPEEARLIRVKDRSEELKRVTQAHGLKGFQGWRNTLSTMRDRLGNRVEIQRKIAMVLERESVAMRGEFTAGIYVYTMATAYNQIQTALKGLEAGRVDIVPLPNQFELTAPPNTFKPPAWVSLRTMVTGSELMKKYLGNYDSLFDSPTEQPIPSWKAIEWLLEDYGLSRVEKHAWDLVYREMGKFGAMVDWTTDPPPAVATNAHFPHHESEEEQVAETSHH